MGDMHWEHVMQSMPARAPPARPTKQGTVPTQKPKVVFNAAGVLVAAAPAPEAAGGDEDGERGAGGAACGAYAIKIGTSAAARRACAARLRSR